MKHTINDIFVAREWIDDFIKDTDYNLKSIDRDIEPGDVFRFDKDANLINYGTIEDIMSTDEFIKWANKYLEKEGDNNGVPNIR